jgi:hypothetical protein
MDIFLLIFVVVVVGLAFLFAKGEKESAEEAAKRPHWQIKGAPDRTVGIHEAACIANQRRAGREYGGKVFYAYDPKTASWSDKQDAKWLKQFGEPNGVFQKEQKKEDELMAKKAYSKTVASGKKSKQKVISRAKISLIVSIVVFIFAVIFLMVDDGSGFSASTTALIKAFSAGGIASGIFSIIVARAL